jgi:transposase-like protein
MARKNTDQATRLQTAEDWLHAKGSISFREFAERHGVNDKTLSNWVREYKIHEANQKMRNIGGSLEEKTQSLVSRPAPGPSRDELQAVISDLQSRLHDLELKHQALLNTVYILGHQVGS